MIFIYSVWKWKYSGRISFLTSNVEQEAYFFYFEFHVRVCRYGQTNKRVRYQRNSLRKKLDDRALKYVIPTLCISRILHFVRICATAIHFSEFYYFTLMVLLFNEKRIAVWLRRTISHHSQVRNVNLVESSVSPRLVLFDRSLMFYWAASHHVAFILTAGHLYPRFRTFEKKDI